MTDKFKNIKKDFPIFARYPKLVYLDTTATAQKPKCVIDALDEFYTTCNANVHRGIYKLSEIATEAYEKSRKVVAGFIGAKSKKEIIFTRNTTESINIVARSFLPKIIRSNQDTVLISSMEHHSNIIPWQIMKKQLNFNLQVIKLTPEYELDMDDLEAKLKKYNVKLIAITHISNVLGTINPVEKIASLAKKHNCYVLVDGAQAVGHIKIDVSKLGVDFYTFSGHKMMGPLGIGVLWAKEKLLEKMDPFLGGGEMINTVSWQSFTPADIPYKFEAGTPNAAGAYALGKACQYLEKILPYIKEHEENIMKYFIENIFKIKDLTVYGPPLNKKIGIFSFSIDNLHAHDISYILDEQNIAVRAGHHCAMPLHKKIIKKPSTVRASFYIYNTLEDIDKLIKGLQKAVKILK